MRRGPPAYGWAGQIAICCFLGALAMAVGWVIGWLL